MKEFPLNRSAWRDGKIALVGQTSACASSRENAVRAIQGHVFRAVIALSSGDIFAQNGLTNDLLRVRLQAATVVIMIAQAGAEPEGEARVDLAAQFVIAADGSRHDSEMDRFAGRCLLEGVGELAFTLSHDDGATAFEQRFGCEDS